MYEYIARLLTQRPIKMQQNKRKELNFDFFLFETEINFFINNWTQITRELSKQKELNFDFHEARNKSFLKVEETTLAK